MNVHQHDLSAEEHAEMRDAILAGAQRIRPATRNAGGLIAGAAALLLVGGIAGSALTFALGSPTTSPATPPVPTLDVPGEPVALTRPAQPDDRLPDALPDHGRAGIDAATVRFVGEREQIRFFIGESTADPDEYCVLIWPEPPSLGGWAMACGGPPVTVTAVGVAIAEISVPAASDPLREGWIALDENVRVWIAP